MPPSSCLPLTLPQSCVTYCSISIVITTVISIFNNDAKSMSCWLAGIQWTARGLAETYCLVSGINSRLQLYQLRKFNSFTEKSSWRCKIISRLNAYIFRQHKWSIRAAEILYGRPECIIKSHLEQVHRVWPIDEKYFSMVISFAKKFIHVSSCQPPMLLEEWIRKLPMSLRIEWARYSQPVYQDKRNILCCNYLKNQLIVEYRTAYFSLKIMSWIRCPG